MQQTYVRGTSYNILELLLSMGIIKLIHLDGFHHYRSALLDFS